MQDGSVLLFSNLLPGTEYLIAVRQITKVGTTITGNVLF
jgi:hypothetical protein